MEETLLTSLSNRINRDLSHRFSAAELLKLAKESGFHKRSSKLKPWMFLDAICFTTMNSSQQSLSQHSCELFLEHQLDISKQGLDQRFNANSIDFIKKLLEKSIAEEYQTTVETGLFKNFNSVRIKDSTSFVLDKNMEDHFPGNGANNTEAVSKVQFEYDIKTGNIIELELTSGKVNDFQNTYSTLHNIKKKDLLIRDLGYVTIDYMRHIQHCEAFFINRLRTDTAIFERKDDKYCRISYKQLSKQLGNKSSIEKDVFIGDRKFLPVRLIVTKVPKDKVEARITRQKRKSVRRVAKFSRQTFIDNAGINLFVTNIDSSILSRKEVYGFYKLRWQIEIIFKIWKSLGQLHINKKTKPERTITMLYAKLLLLIVNWKIIKQVAHLPLKEKGIVLSTYKSFKLLLSIQKTIARFILGRETTNNIFISVYELLLKKCLSEDRNERESYSSIVKYLL